MVLMTLTSSKMMLIAVIRLLDVSARSFVVLNQVFTFQCNDGENSPQRKIIK